VEEARALMTEALAGVDRDALLAERAEAEAQLRAAEATLGVGAAVANGQAASGEETDTPAQNQEGMGPEPAGGPSLDVAELRRAAARARAADDLLARAASEAAGRPPAPEPVPGSGDRVLGGAEDAFARALELREDVPAAWRRLVGAMISATGMAIVIGALGWDTYWLLVPIALIAIMTVDLRVSAKAAREASAEAAEQLTALGSAEGGVEAVRQERARLEEAERRLAEARADRDAAYAAFAALAPGHLPSEVDDVIADYEAEVAARAAAQPETVEPETVEPETAEPVPATPSEPEPEADAVALPKADWWFASEPPAEPVPVAAAVPAASPPAPIRALAERLSAEGREALARIEAQLAALERVELAKKSLEWHEAQASSPPDD
jgi:hypothetical protein